MTRWILLLVLFAVGCSASAPPPAEPKPLEGNRIPKEAGGPPMK